MFSALGLGLAAFALLLAADPFATGRLTPLDRPAMFAASPRMAHASRLRDPGFNAAVIGNSTLQILQPERLNALSGLSFVQLTIPGTGPYEQGLMLRELVRRRGSALRAVVIGIDSTWCNPDNAGKPLSPFPSWLFDASDLRYAAGLFRMSSLEALPRRLGALRGSEPLARADGLWDYEVNGYRPGASPATDAPVAEIAPRPGRQAASGHLAEMLRTLPAGTAATIIFPPVFQPEGAPPSPAGVRARAACKAEIVGEARQAMPAVVVHDYWTDDPAFRSPANFADALHIRAPLAMRIERDIAQGLAR